MYTPAFQNFIAPAQAYPQAWRIPLAVVVAVTIWVIWVIVVLIAIMLTSGFENFDLWVQRMAQATTPTSVLLMLSTFIGCVLGTIIAVKVFHGRSWLTLLGPRVVQTFFLGAGVAIVIFIASDLLIADDIELTPNTTISLWLSFLPMALIAIFIQTGAEEVLFRGYLQQQLAVRFTSPLMWMLLPSVLFGVAHWNPEVPSDVAIAVVAAATVFGLITADLTRATGSIGAAWGLHFVNNTLSILYVSLDGTFSGLALYTTTFTAMESAVLMPLIARDVVVLALIWGLIRAAVRMRG